MKPATHIEADTQRVLEYIDSLRALLRRAGAVIPDEHLHQSLERLDRLHEEVTAGHSQIKALSATIRDLERCVDELGKQEKRTRRVE